MRIVRFLSNGKIHLGIPDGKGRARKLAGSLFGELLPTESHLEIEKLLSPLVPADILCIGLNYRDHAAEGGVPIPQKPLLFIKAGSSLNHPNAPIPIPELTDQVDFEAELAVIIGRAAKRVSREDALQYVFGYTCANDVSARDWQKEKSLGGGQFARGKSFDGFCPIGPELVSADELPDPGKLRIRSLLNGKVMQDQNSGNMIFSVPELIESLSSTMTLRPGTIILTGTPAGVGFARKPPVWLRPGDRIEVEIEGIGSLVNPIGPKEGPDSPT